MIVLNNVLINDLNRIEGDREDENVIDCYCSFHSFEYLHISLNFIQVLEMHLVCSLMGIVEALRRLFTILLQHNYFIACIQILKTDRIIELYLH